MDAITAFLQGELNEEVIYMEQSVGHVDTAAPKKICLLQKALYGLKQSNRVWNKKLDAELNDIGLKRSSFDPCVYYHVQLIIIAVCPSLNLDTPKNSELEDSDEDDRVSVTIKTPNGSAVTNPEKLQQTNRIKLSSSGINSPRRLCPRRTSEFSPKSKTMKTTTTTATAATFVSVSIFIQIISRRNLINGATVLRRLRAAGDDDDDVDGLILVFCTISVHPRPPSS
ncbi:uncharacterized protein LOC134291700 [Aedes albopictus]|uniref:Reverse transcriptase Ty1/copia-type domain-containing protein n=1 Tax=Aedes albopictus TaxID=7160 RepID=A0ABM1ZSY7_AEDAL